MANFKRIVKANDYFGNESTFGIIWETVCMTCTFAVGIDFNDTNELSIFYVYNMGRDDIYDCLNTLFINVYQQHGYSYEEKIKKEMAEKIKEVLTARVKAGMITVEQIERWVKNG